MTYSTWFIKGSSARPGPENQTQTHKRRWLPSHTTVLGESVGKQELGLAGSCLHAVTQTPPERGANLRAMEPKGGKKTSFASLSSHKMRKQAGIMRVVEASSPNTE